MMARQRALKAPAGMVLVFMGIRSWSLYHGHNRAAASSSARSIFTAASIVLRVEHAAQCGHMTDELSWLQQWYSAQCDGEWEHGFGITIETIDNPGWSVKISLEGTELAAAPFEPVKNDVSETNWIQCRVAERKAWPTLRSSPNYRAFEGHGGALNLPDIIKTFRTWAETKH